jgi:2-dehydropantoate 2-reductase
VKILVMGAGGVGGWYGAKLAAAGHHVAMVARGAHLAALQEAGAIVVREPDGREWRAPVDAVEEPVDAGTKVDLALLAVKARDHAAAMDLLYPVVHPSGEGTLVLTLQNGIDLHESLLERFGGAALWGVARIGAGIAAPGVIEHVAMGELTIGEPKGGASTRIAAVARMFEAAGVPCQVSEDVRRDLWVKLAWNAAFNAVGALAGKTVGECLESEPLRAVIADGMREALAVASAEGVTLPAMPDTMIEAMLGFSASIGGVRTSMLQDRLRGAETEHDALSGAVARRGAAHGVATPVNATLTRLLAGLALRALS